MTRKRELSLLLAGALLVKSTRAEVLAKLCDGLDDDLAHIVSALRAGSSEPYREWLKKRGVHVGNDAISAIAEALVSEKLMEKVNAQIGELKFAGLVEDMDTFRQRLESILESIK
jgi:hypothetical protein